jgi:hypothetical protein
MWVCFSELFSMQAISQTKQAKWYDKYERLWKEAVVAYLKVLSRNLLGGIKEIHDKY